MNKLSINHKSAQAGFTLIELIVVIVILGILAATALPKFTSLSGEARVASLQGARGALSAAAAMAHGKFLLNPTVAAQTVEGNTMTFVITPAASISGYPVADAGFAGAAGIALPDYAVIVGGSAGVAATTTAPAAPPNGFAVVPSGIANTATAVTCFISYTAPTTVGGAPVLSTVPAATSC